MSGCLVRERARDGIKYGTGILVQFEHTNVLKRAPFFENELEQDYEGRHVTALTYSNTLFALLLPPPVNVSGCLVRERVRKEKKYMVLVYLYNSNTLTFRKGRPFFKTSWNKPPLSDM